MSTYERLTTEAAELREQADAKDQEAAGLQLSRADLEEMSPQAINEARRAGRLDDVRRGSK